MRISDWSSDVCSSDLHAGSRPTPDYRPPHRRAAGGGATVTFQGNERRLAPQGLILDPMDALVLRRGFLRQPRPLGQLKTKIVESLAVGEVPGEGTPVDPPKALVLIRSQIGTTQVCTTVTNAHPLCRPL